MGTVDLDNRLDDPLFDLFHAVKFFIQDPPRFLRIDRRKIIALPLNVHHNGKCALSMPPLLSRHFVGAGNGKVSSCPETDVVRQCPSGTGHKIRDALNAGQLHAVPGFLLVLVREFLRRRITGKKAFDHKLQKSILRGELSPASESDLPDLIDGILIPNCRAGELHIDMILSQPFQKAHKPGIDFQNIRINRSISIFQFKSGPSDRVCKDAAGMVLQFSLAVIQH